MTLYNNKNACDQDPNATYGKHKRGALVSGLSEFYALAGNDKKAKRCKECGNFLEFGDFEHIDTGELKRSLTRANFCDVRWCPMCAWRKSLRLTRELESILDQAEAKQPLRYLFLTLTMKNPPLAELRQSIKTINEAFNLLTKKPEFEHVLGFFKTVELLGDETKQGEAHPHLHILLAVKPSYFARGYVSQAKWTEAWRRSLKVDYTPIVDVRTIKPKGEAFESRMSAVLEVTKYQVKPSSIKDMGAEDFKLFDQQTKGTRSHSRGGILKSIEPIDTEQLDPEKWKLIKRKFYEFHNGKYELLEEVISR